MSSSILHYGDNKNTEGLAARAPRSLRAISSSKTYRPMRAQRMVERCKRRFSEALQTDTRSTCNRHQISEEGLVSAANNR